MIPVVPVAFRQHAAKAVTKFTSDLTRHVHDVGLNIGNRLRRCPSSNETASMNSVLTIGFVVMLTFLVQALLMDNDATHGEQVEPVRSYK